jgi:hypothetical protein
MSIDDYIYRVSNIRIFWKIITLSYIIAYLSFPKE